MAGARDATRLELQVCFFIFYFFKTLTNNFLLYIQLPYHPTTTTGGLETHQTHLEPSLYLTMTTEGPNDAGRVVWATLVSFIL